jgi:hypothetical protein
MALSYKPLCLRPQKPISTGTGLAASGNKPGAGTTLLLYVRMTPCKMASLLVAEFPALATDIQAPQMAGKVYRQRDCWAVFVRRALRTNHPEVLRRCLEVADSLLRHADRYLSAAIENVYLQGMHLDSSIEDARVAHQLMAPSLYQAYCLPRTSVYL